MKSQYDLKLYCKYVARGQRHLQSYRVTFPNGNPYYDYITTLPQSYHNVELTKITRKLPVQGPRRWIKWLEPKYRKIPCIFG